ncbi:MAG: iron ABC transporter permease [Nitrospirae bacterium]|nr:iron ABC transporter permease [Nitrospirota bacterium]
MKLFRVVLVMGGVLVLAAAAAVTVGTVEIGPADILRSLLFPDPAGNSARDLIIRQLRLPRVVMAIIVGASLASVGASLQSLLRNPLADPYLLGVSSGAALGAVIGIEIGVGASTGFAFAGALAATVLVFVLATRHHRLDPQTLLLAGVVLNSILGAAMTLVMIFLQPHQIQSVVYWLLGNIRPAGWAPLAFLSLGLIVGFGLLFSQARALDLLAQGEESARQLGVRTERCKVIVLFASALLTTLAVSFNGLIGFVGLIVPHAARFLFGPDNRLLVPASALLGAGVLVCADTLARTVLSPTELPVGALTALAGGPFFLLLLRKGRRILP